MGQHIIKWNNVLKMCIMGFLFICVCLLLPVKASANDFNLIENGEFDLDPSTSENWKTNIYSSSGETHFIWDDSTFHGSNEKEHSLKIKGNNTLAEIYNDVVIQPGKIYHFRAWREAENVIVSNDDLGSYIQIEQYDKEGNIINNTKQSYTSVKSTYFWNNVNFYFVADKKAAKVRVMLGLDGSGSVWYDDVSLQEIDDTVAKLPVNLEANPGQDKSTYKGLDVNLDGSKSIGASNYKWRIISKPAESKSNLFDNNDVYPYFIPDVVGNYIIGLVVNNGEEDSQESQVLIKVKDWNDTTDDFNYHQTDNSKCFDQFTVSSIFPLTDGWAILGNATHDQIEITNIITGKGGIIYQLDGVPTKIDFDFYHNVIIAALKSSNKIAKIDINTSKITYITTSAPVVDLTMGEGNVAFAYTNNINLSNISIIDLNNNIEKKVIPLLGNYCSIGLIKYDKVNHNLFLGDIHVNPSSLYRYSYDKQNQSLTYAEHISDAGDNGQDLSISADGKHLAFSTGSGNKHTHTITDFNSLNLTEELGEWNMDWCPSSADFSNDSKYIVTSDTVDTRLFDVSTHKFIRKFDLIMNASLVRFSRGNGFIFICAEGKLYIENSGIISFNTKSVTIDNINTDKVSPQNVESKINITVNASGGTNLLYGCFICKDNAWNVVQRYSDNNTFQWTPTEPGIYSVVTEVKDKSSNNDYDAINITNYEVLSIEKEEKTEVSLNFSVASKVYDGKEAVRTDVKNNQGYTGEYNCLYKSTDGQGYSSSKPPKDAGSYICVVSIPEEVKNYTGEGSETFDIFQKGIIIVPEDKSMVYGDPIPQFTYNYAPGFELVDGDSLITEPILSTKEITEPGNYEITVSGAKASNNYFFSKQNTYYAKLDVNTPDQLYAYARKNGSISPQGYMLAKGTKPQTFIITPDDNYVINSVLIDGIDVGPVTSYTFDNLKGGGNYHDIGATFKPSQGKGDNYCTVYNGIDYAAVYDYNYYSAFCGFTGDKNVLEHFVKYGMPYGDQGCADFNVKLYKSKYPDLQNAFGEDLAAYYLHYITNGKAEGRTASGIIYKAKKTTVYKGVDYSAVYNYNYYIANYPNVKNTYGDDDAKILQDFVENGIPEGRRGNEEFDVQAYRNNYVDLQNAFGNDLKSYYMHYIINGKAEGRSAKESSSNPKGITVYNGVDYSAVYNYNYYIANYPNVKNTYGDDDAKILQDFVENGIPEGRRGNEEFDVQAYRNNYVDLQNAFGNDLKSYYMHYIINGKAEGRSAKGSSSNPKGITVYNGVDYSAVYDYKYYIANYPSVKSTYGDDDAKILQDFVENGIPEGRRGNEEFDVQAYRNNYADLQNAFGNDLKSYYMHYIINGKAEGRSAKGSSSNPKGITVYNGVDYSAVYDYKYYIANYPSVKSTYGDDDAKILQDFVENGIPEGRRGNEEFDVQAYRNNYTDLQNAFGNDLKSYYMHYIINGKAEGRSAKGSSCNPKGITVYNGVDYSAVYDYNYYITNYPDIKNTFGDDDKAVLAHFVNIGMAEGRRGSSEFDINIYKNNYIDLQNAFGDNLSAYYIHYIQNGKYEGRIAK